MSVNKSLAAAAGLVALLVAAQAIAGTMFRLEIGPAVAAGIEKSKFLKKDQVKKIALLVRPRVCDSMATVQITGRAEGLVNGMRQSVPLNLLTIDPEEGIYAVQQEWPNDGQWVLQLNGTCASPKASASTLVPMNKGTFIREKTEVLREPATKKQLEAALSALARSQS
jgi:hypothetical protein